VLLASLASAKATVMKMTSLKPQTSLRIHMAVMPFIVKTSRRLGYGEKRLGAQGSSLV